MKKILYLIALIILLCIPYKPIFAEGNDTLAPNVKNGLIKEDSTWYYYENGEVTGLNGLARNDWGWWYIGSDGRIDQSFNGVAANEWGTWCVINGKVNTSVNGLTKVGNTWYYFKNGKVYAAGWLQKNDWGWWKIGSNGQIDFNFNGIASNEWGTWFVQNGRVNTSVNGLTKVGNTWYYFKNGKITGLNALAKNAYGWWYIGSNGKIDTSFNGVASNEWGLWYVRNGKLDQSVNGLRNINGTWYYFRNGKVSQAPHTVCIDAGHQRHANSSPEPIGPGSSTTKKRVSGGTSGVATGVPEYQLNLTIAKLLANDLRAAGINVVMVRDSHDVNISNAERAQIANTCGADVFLRIHADGSTNSAVRGAHTICMTSSNPWNARLHNDSYRLSSSVISNYCAATGIGNRGISLRDDLSGTNWSQIPVCLIELGFMTNPTEDRLMNDPGMQARMAQGICNGILEYYR